jgi:hypothetical protein
MTQSGHGALAVPRTGLPGFGRDGFSQGTFSRQLASQFWSGQSQPIVPRIQSTQLKCAV